MMLSCSGKKFVVQRHVHPRLSRDGHGPQWNAVSGQDGGALFELQRGLEVGGGMEGVLTEQLAHGDLHLLHGEAQTNAHPRSCAERHPRHGVTRGLILRTEPVYRKHGLVFEADPLSSSGI